MESIKIITYNIDGLPEKLDLNDLPWIFKPISWIYKLIKGTTIIQINDDINKSNNISTISWKLSQENPDIICVQEDFNYHKELTYNLVGYNVGTYLGGFDLSKIFKTMTWFPPRFISDGLNILIKNSKYTILSEDIVPWKKSCGYFNNANDKLIHKGFRVYTLYSLCYNNFELDIYNIHMDADFYKEGENIPEGDIKARISQCKQLCEYIINRHKEGHNNPIIIIGDTNCNPNKYSWDSPLLSSYLVIPISNIKFLDIQEIYPENFYDVDKIFVINNKKSKYKLEDIKCYFDESFKGLSDHCPLITIFDIKPNER